MFLIIFTFICSTYLTFSEKLQYNLQNGMKSTYYRDAIWNFWLIKIIIIIIIGSIRYKRSKPFRRLIALAVMMLLFSYFVPFSIVLKCAMRKIAICTIGQDVVYFSHGKEYFNIIDEKYKFYVIKWMQKNCLS